MHSDKNLGEFTYELDMRKSVIDLLLCKTSHISEISKFKIRLMQPTESDHKPLAFTIELPAIINLEGPINEGIIIKLYKWNQAKFEMYLTNYENNKCQGQLDNLLISLIDAENSGDVICSTLYSYIESA